MGALLSGYCPVVWRVRAYAVFGPFPGPNILLAKVKEAIWIKKTKPTLNRDSGYSLSPIYSR